MAKGWKRYGEARLYFIGGSLSLMVLLWSVLFARDHATVGREAVPVSVIEAPTARSVPQTTSSQNPTVAPTQAPQTRTRGS